MSAVGATKDLWQIQNAAGFVPIIKWHIIRKYRQRRSKIHFLTEITNIKPIYLS